MREKTWAVKGWGESVKKTGIFDSFQWASLTICKRESWLHSFWIQNRQSPLNKRFGIVCVLFNLCGLFLNNSHLAIALGLDFGFGECFHWCWDGLVSMAANRIPWIADFLPQMSFFSSIKASVKDALKQVSKSLKIDGDAYDCPVHGPFIRFLGSAEMFNYYVFRFDFSPLCW